MNPMRIVLGLLPLILAGCQPAAETPTTSSTEPPKTETAATTQPAEQDSQKKDVPVDQLINADGTIDDGLSKTASPGAKLPKDGDPIAILTTNQGRIVVKFFPEKAPKHVANFLKLGGEKFYDGTKFHRVIPGFMIQGGDPNTKSDSNRSRWGTGGPGWTVKAEFNRNKHSRGALSMARSQDPNSAGSQFFIVLKDANFLDGQYTVFGRVTSGMDAVDKIAALKTDQADAPVDADQARMVKVTVSRQ